MSVSPASGASAHLSERLKNLANRSIAGLIFIILGVLLQWFLVIGESIPALKIAVEFVKLFAEAFPWVKLTVGYNGLFLIAIGIGSIVYAIWQFNRGVRATTPEETLKSFYQHGVLDLAGCYEIAWNCLTREARAQFVAIEHFENHWKELREELITRNLVFFGVFLIENVAVLQEDDNSCTVSFDIVLTDSRSISRNPLSMKQFRFHQTATLCKSEGNWYLASGEVDFSESNRLPY